MSEITESRELSAAAEGRCPSCGGTCPDLSSPCPHCHAPPFGPADPARTPTDPLKVASDKPRQRAGDALMQVRASDIEPYIGLRYLSKLFRLMAIILILLLVAEVITGFISQGSAAIPTLLAEVSKLSVSAALLWASGDLAILMIDIGHDVRATRILMGRQAAHHLIEHQQERRHEAARADAVRAELSARDEGGGRR